MIDLYRKLNPGASPSDIYFLIASDYRYGAPTMIAAQRRAALGKAPVYLYYFTWETPVQGGRLKSPHTMEIPFAFDNVKISARMTGGGAEAMALADKVSDAWIAFARTGDPNTPKLPHWPAYDAKDRATMVINNVEQGGQRSVARAAPRHVPGVESELRKAEFQVETGVSTARRKLRPLRSFPSAIVTMSTAIVTISNPASAHW